MICFPFFFAALVVMPRRAWAAFRCGRRCHSLFDDVHAYDGLLDLTVGDLRRRIGLPPEGLALDA